MLPEVCVQFSLRHPRRSEKKKKSCLVVSCLVVVFQLPAWLFLSTRGGFFKTRKRGRGIVSIRCSFLRDARLYSRPILSFRTSQYTKRHHQRKETSLCCQMTVSPTLSKFRRRHQKTATASCAVYWKKCVKLNFCRHFPCLATASPVRLCVGACRKFATWCGYRSASSSSRGTRSASTSPSSATTRPGRSLVARGDR